MTSTYSIDFSKNDEAAYEGLGSALEGKDIGILGMFLLILSCLFPNETCLVNNVGKSHNMPVYFAETPKDEMVDIVAVNVNATLRTTHIVLPGMIEKYGWQVVLSSICLT